MITTEFDKTNHLFLSYPKRFYNEYESLIPFYDELISLIPDDIHIYIIAGQKHVVQEIKDKFNNKNIDVILARNWDEIWLRDCMGLNMTDRIIKPIYYPNYCDLKKYWNYFKEINNLTKSILKDTLNKEIINIPLILDGGNFVNNSSIAFLTHKAIEDNPNVKILEMISDYCGLIPVIVDRNQHDAIGHTDGYMAFNNEQSIFISRYPHKTSTITDVEYTQHLIYTAVSCDLEVIPIYDLPSTKKGYCGCEKAKPCFYSAEGTYINFLRLNDTIILPEYSNCKSQGKDLNVVNENILLGCGFKVLKINCDLLATFGGSLHCISWQA